MRALERLSVSWDRMWFQGGPDRTRVSMLRGAFYGLLAFDLWVLMAPRTYRAGAGGFDVAQLTWLQGVLPLPRPEWFLFAALVGGLLSLRIAVGVAQRWEPAALAVLYCVPYYWSQQDGYQHHHLLAMFLVINCFVPWDRSRWRAASEASRTWPLKLLYVQVSVVYLFTAITKVDQWWLNGWALHGQISTPWVRSTLDGLVAGAGLSELGPYAVIAHVVMIWQFFVCVAFLVPRLRPLACATGPVFHVLVEVIGLKIRWFSYYMVALYYLLLFPDPWFNAIALPVKRRLVAVQSGALSLGRRVGGGRPPPATLTLMAAALGGALAWSLPYPGMVPVAGAFLLVGLVGGRAWSRSLTTTLAAVVLAALTHWGGVAYDFHRLDGGDKRMRGDLTGAIEAYERAVEVRPRGDTSRVAKLADLYRRVGRTEDAERLDSALDPGEGSGGR